jgi:hypothetical protein
VILAARRIRDEWEIEPDIIDEILNRTRPNFGSEVPAEGFVEDETILSVWPLLQ